MIFKEYSNTRLIFSKKLVYKKSDTEIPKNDETFRTESYRFRKNKKLKELKFKYGRKKCFHSCLYTNQNYKKSN